MQSLTLAYRDDDRTPVICAIRAMAARHYDLDVRIVKIKTAATIGGAFQRRAASDRQHLRDRDHRIPRRNRIEPFTLWDLHWVKGLDDAGFIDDLAKRLTEG